MSRFPTMTLAALAIFALPLAAVAENQNPPAASETVVLAAVEDAMPTTVPTREGTPTAENVVAAETKRPAHGSSQSMASFRFSDPYAYPQQTLPVNFPSLPSFGF